MCDLGQIYCSLSYNSENQETFPESLEIMRTQMSSTEEAGVQAS